MEYRVIKKIKRKILDWLSIHKADRVYAEVVFVSSMNDIPPSIGSKIFIVERDDVKRWVVFECQQHGERIEVNLMKSKRPCWNIEVKRKKVSLWPSIVVENEKCDDHFWLRNNKAYLVSNYYGEL